MPYITKEDREFWEDRLNPLLSRIGDSTSEGDLNYIIFRILLKASKKSYARFNALMGVMESCKQEFYRRVVAEYEDEKKAENGEIWEKTNIV